MGKLFGVNTKISGKVGQYIYRQTKRGTIVSELPVKPAIPRRSARQMDRRTQWGNVSEGSPCGVKSGNYAPK